MSRGGNSRDPRVQRTRQLLLEAFMALVQEKRTIHSISIQEIATRATVNRATFYAHFEDKAALVLDWSREKFQRALVSQLPTSSTLQRETLHRLILAVFDFLALSRRYYRPSNRQFEPLYEMAIQQELSDLLLRWLQQVPSAIALPEETIETTAQAISWAIFGPAAQWSRGDQSTSKEVMAHHVLAIVVAGLSPVVTVT
ncbi:MAG TPA: TetR/AcrR family transcriptional regulator [Ktedonobacteraceae bacterium]|nr:TetR/AcrR family transcriptional regulator [Ktedonobacteraceae bacterium]